MINQLYLPFALSVLLVGTPTLSAFAPTKPTRVVSSATTGSLSPVFQSVTLLRAEETDETEEAPKESDPPASDASNDILNSPAFLKRKIDVLKSDIEQAENQISDLTNAVEEGKAEWGEQLDKLQAEYKNIQERLGNQNKQGDTMATVEVARGMLSVLDNFDRAFGAVTAETDEQKEIEAEFKATYQQILDIFESLGVTTVETVGTEFNYEYHQAVMQIPSEDYEEGIVCEELAKGFKLGETLIRASMVAVAA